MIIDNDNDNDSDSDSDIQISCCEVRTVDVLSLCDGLIIPGGESTTMALLATKNGMVSDWW